MLPPLSLYLHFPWCIAKCPYCDFNSHALAGTLPVTEYFEALARDLEFQGTQSGRRVIGSVFLGGGTPSLFSGEAIGRVLETARRHLNFAAHVEITLEANPGTLERGRFAEYRSAGVNRVSLGAQSFDAGQLRTLGRIHSPAQTQRAAEELHAAGLTNFNLDLMYGLPGQDTAAALSDIDHVLALSPAHVSHYQLTLEPGTAFAARPPRLPGEDAIVEILAACQERLADAGFARYEVSAYARVGAQCAHNLNYWNFGDYLGVGAGAHGKITLEAGGAIMRSAQWREPRRYMANSPRPQTCATVATADLPFEFMLNALRLVDGFAIARFEEYTRLPWGTVARQIARLCERGLIQIEAEGCRSTPRGLTFLNDALVEFLPEKPVSAGHSALSTAT
jgi:putative oxygen-independent coproporphyrinogen III oxidase